MSGVSINTSKDEIEKLLAVQMLMSIVKMPRYEMYWSEQTRYEPVASTLTLKRYKKLREYLHVVNNADKENPENKDDKCFKVRPLLEAVRANCLKVEPEVNNSIDEQIIPAKTKKSGGVRQYNPKKPHKWGFKNLVRAGESGIIYDFFLYGGKHSTGGNSCSAETIVLKLAEGIPKHKGYRLFFDNWFSTLHLMLKLKSSGIFTTATFRTNRLKGCPLASDKELKKEGRGSYDYRTDVNSGIHVVKWYDNKCVHLASTFSGVGTSGFVKRWDSKRKSHKNVSLPDMVSDYNSSMGGVDLADMLITLYRTEITTKKRWYLKLIFHMVDICKVNGWLLYRRFCDQQSIPKKDQKPLLLFIADLANALRLSEKPKSVGRPKKRSLSPQPTIGKKAAVAKPVPDVRYDLVDHFPEFGEKRGRCRYCPDGYSYVYCRKCNIVLCLRKNNNCFYDFHH